MTMGSKWTLLSLLRRKMDTWTTNVSKPTPFQTELPQGWGMPAFWKHISDGWRWLTIHLKVERMRLRNWTSSATWSTSSTGTLGLGGHLKVSFMLWTSLERPLDLMWWDHTSIEPKGCPWGMHKQTRERESVLQCSRGLAWWRSKPSS